MHNPAILSHPWITPRT